MSENTPYKYLDFHVWGDYALFSNPITSLSGELCSYQVPTFSALRGITESIYWKPTISWRPVSVRIMNPIRFEARSRKLPNYYGPGCDLGYRTYLKDVSYQVRVALNWSLDENYKEDRKPCTFGSGAGYYDGIDMSMGLMFHSHTYPNQAYNKATTKKLTTNMWNCDMNNGIITFPDPKDCPIHRVLHDAKPIWVKPKQIETQTE